MKKSYTVVSHNQHTHNILFNDNLMANESFMMIGVRELADGICAILNEWIQKSEEPTGKTIEIPSVDDVVKSRKFHALSTPRYMIEQTIFYCAKVFGVEKGKS